MGQRFNNVYRTCFVWVLGFLLMLVDPYAFQAQNLVPNPGFEEYDECPFEVDVDGPMPCSPWISTYSANYFNECNPGPGGVPENFQGYQHAHTGVGYVGGYPNYGGGGGGEFVQVPLLEPLIEGQCYEVSFWANLANNSCGINYLGAAFSDNIDGWPGFLFPRLDGFYEYYSDTSDWMLIQGKMIAFGGETYLTLGNFHSQEETESDPDCPPEWWYAYYYFDDVSVVPMPTEPYVVDLGGPIESCFPVTLDPGIDGATYLWNDGSTEQTLTVDTSGTYSVVVTLGDCHGGVGTVDVTILEHNYVSLPDDTTLCAGDEFVISLDDSVGEYIWQDGSTVSTYTISSPGLYAVTLDDGCVISTDEIEVYGQDIPFFSLGPDTLLCPGSSLFLNFDSELGDFVWQDFSTNSYYNINMAGMYALTITNQCGEHMDELEVIELEPPMLDLGSETDILCPGETISIVLDPQQGEYIWQDGSTSTDYTITSEGLYSVTVSNPCGEAMDSVLIEPLEPPDFNFGFDSLFLCPGESTWIGVTGMEGEFSWNTGATDPSIQVSGTGEYVLTVSNACGSDSAQVVVDVPPVIEPPDLGPDLVLCDGQPLEFQIMQQGVSVLWNDTLNSPVFVVTASGTYHVEVSSSCESFSDTISVVFEHNAPVVDLPEQVGICEGESILIVPDVSDVDYLWSDGSQLSYLEISSPGTYSVTVSNLCGTSYDSVVVVSNGLAPMGILPSDTSVCPGDTLILIPEFLNADSWMWSDGSTDSTFTASASGEVSLAVHNACGTGYDSMLIHWLPDLPAFSLGADTVVCPGDSVFLMTSIPDVLYEWSDGSALSEFMAVDSGQISLVISNGCMQVADTILIGWEPPVPELMFPDSQSLCQGEVITISPDVSGVDFLWHDGSTESEFEVNQPETVYLTISDDCSSRTDSTVFYVSNEGPQLDLGDDITICEGETVTLQAGIFGVDFLWQDGSTNSYFEITQAGEYSLTVENSCGMSIDSIRVISAGFPPLVHLGNDTILCQGESLHLAGSNAPDIVYQWQDNSTLPYFHVIEPGQYILTELNQCGVSSDTIQVNFLSPPATLSLGSDTTLCFGELLILEVDSFSDHQMIWQDGSSVSMFSVTQSGIYAVTVSNHCGESIDTIVVSYENPLQSIDLGQDTVICPEDIILLQPEWQAGEYVWHDGSNNAEYMVSTPGLVSLTVTNLCGQVSDEILVEFEQSPVFTIDTTAYYICDDEFELDATQLFEASYSWSTGEISPTIQASSVGIYSVFISTRCFSTTLDMHVEADPDCISPEFYFPNVFSPNHDQVNDEAILVIPAEIETTNVRGEIYSRWGELVSASDQIPFSWDGTSNGEPLLPGVYVYRIQITYLTSEGERTEHLIGDITIIR